jgi:hypothetical protein
MEEQTSAMHSLQRELDELKETRNREKEREARRARQDEEDIQILRNRCEKLEQERPAKQTVSHIPLLPSTVFHTCTHRQTQKSSNSCERICKVSSRSSLIFPAATTSL